MMTITVKDFRTREVVSVYPNVVKTTPSDMDSHIVLYYQDDSLCMFPVAGMEICVSLEENNQ